jgi:cyclophilin family peptidyl-prolyl cis-trans isomerase
MRNKIIKKYLLNVIFFIVLGLLVGGCDSQTQDLKSKETKKEMSAYNSTALSGDAKAITESLQKKAKMTDKNEINQKEKKNEETADKKITKENNLKSNESKNMSEKQKTVNENIDMTFAETCEEATIKTNMGNIVIKFYGEKAPTTVANFCTLASKGFYDGIKFHRVINNFMIQTGDPGSKDNTKKDTWGMGGPGYKFKDELPQAGEYKLGSVAMANSGPNTNGSQFFIVSGQSGVTLPPLYSLFGEVIQGLDIVEKIQKVETEEKGVKDRPVSPVLIEGVKLKIKK